MTESEAVTQRKLPKVDGPISRHLNRRFSVPLAERLVHVIWITPNRVSWVALLLAVTAAISYGLSGVLMPSHIWFGGLLFMPTVVLGGILAQISSIIDGVDGDLARLRNASTVSGGVLDAVLDRYADIAIIMGLALAVGAEGASASVLPLGLVQVTMTGESLLLLLVLALSGSLMVSYSRARLEHADLFEPERWTLLGASRDVRLFLIFICSVLSCPLLALVIVAVAGNLTVAARMTTMLSRTSRD